MILQSPFMTSSEVLLPYTCTSSVGNELLRSKSFMLHELVVLCFLIENILLSKPLGVFSLTP